MGLQKFECNLLMSLLQTSLYYLACQSSCQHSLVPSWTNGIYLKVKFSTMPVRNCSRENHCTWWRFCTNVPSIWSNDKLRTSAARYFPMESSPVESWKNYICSFRVIPNSNSFFWVCTTSGTYKFSHLWWASPMSDNKFGSMPSWPVILVHNNVLGQHRPVCSTCRCSLWVANMYMLLSRISFQSFLWSVRCTCLIPTWQ